MLKHLGQNQWLREVPKSRRPRVPQAQPMKAIIRQEARHCVMKWVKSEQQVADCLTKELLE